MSIVIRIEIVQYAAIALKNISIKLNLFLNFFLIFITYFPLQKLSIVISIQ